MRPSLWSAISRVSVLNRWVSGPSLRSPFSNFRFGVPETGSICGRDWFADPHCGRRWPLGDRYALNSPSMVKAGTVIFAKGDPGDSLFAVVAGTVRVSVPSPDGNDTVFSLLNEGEIFGEMALLDGRPRSAEVCAVTNCAADDPGADRRWRRAADLHGDVAGQYRRRDHLLPVIDRLRRRFDIARVCVVADRGMISAETLAELEARRLL